MGLLSVPTLRMSIWVQILAENFSIRIGPSTTVLRDLDVQIFHSGPCLAIDLAHFSLPCVAVGLCHKQQRTNSKGTSYFRDPTYQDYYFRGGVIIFQLRHPGYRHWYYIHLEGSMSSNQSATSFALAVRFLALGCCSPRAEWDQGWLGSQDLCLRWCWCRFVLEGPDCCVQVFGSLGLEVHRSAGSSCVRGSAGSQVGRPSGSQVGRFTSHQVLLQHQMRSLCSWFAKFPPEDIRTSTAFFFQVWTFGFAVCDLWTFSYELSMQLGFSFFFN